jgi:hypothetical protein
MAEVIETVDHLLTSVIAVVARRTSDTFAVTILGNAINHLQEKYPFLQNIEILDTQYIETEQFISINESLKNIDQENLSESLSELINMVTTSMGRYAGFFFIREIKDHIGFECDTSLKKINVDLDILQYGFTFDRIKRLAQSIDAHEITKKLIQISIDISKHVIPYREAIPMIARIIDNKIPEYNFLEYITINDIRFTQGTEEIFINKALNQVPISKLSEAMEIILKEINISLEETGYFSFVNELNRSLGSEYRVKMEELQYTINIQQFGLQIIIKNVLLSVIHTIQSLDITKQPGLLIQSKINSVSERYAFLKDITINESALSKDDECILFTSDFNDASGLEVGRSLKLIIQHLMKTMPREDSLIFIKQLRSSLDQGFITKLEVMGLNLYMLQLRQEVRIST